MAITDTNGVKLEQRHFDAWGNLTHLKIGTNATITDANQIRDYLANGNLVIDRGYTSHEHFAEVGIIHMNGRLYDPLLRRFLNADENIQDPTNTQNYNKYGYVMNNPLMFNDPSGECLLPLFGYLVSAWIAGAAVGVMVAAGMYMIKSLVTGTWSWGGFARSLLIGAITGGATGGLLGMYSATGFNGAVVLGSMNGAIGGGVEAIFSGQNFFTGLYRGAVMGAAIGSAIGGISWVADKLFTNNEKPYLEMHGSEYTDPKSYSDYQNTPLTQKEIKEAFSQWKDPYGDYGFKQKVYLMKQGSTFGDYNFNSDGTAFISGSEKAGAFTITTYSGGKIGDPAFMSKIYLPKNIYSKAQLHYWLNHEFGHAIIEHSYGKDNIYNIINKDASNILMNTPAHISIQYTGQKFLEHNGWLNFKLRGVFDGSFIGGLVPDNVLTNLLKKLIIKIK